MGWVRLLLNIRRVSTLLFKWERKNGKLKVLDLKEMKMKDLCARVELTAISSLSTVDIAAIHQIGIVG